MAVSVAEWTSIMSTGLAAVAATLSAMSIFRVQQLAREQRANDSVKKYLELSIRHPTLSSESDEDRHDWFFSFLLLTIHDVLRAYKGDKSWELMIENQLRLHRETLVAWKDYDEENSTDFLGSFWPRCSGVH